MSIEPSFLPPPELLDSGLAGLIGYLIWSQGKSNERREEASKRLEESNRELLDEIKAMDEKLLKIIDKLMGKLFDS